MDLTEAQWQVLRPLLTPQRRPDGRGRPWRDARAVLNGILWILRTGAPWHDLPDRYPPYQTCHRRFQQWQRDVTYVDFHFGISRAHAKNAEPLCSFLSLGSGGRGPPKTGIGDRKQDQSFQNLIVSRGEWCV